MPGTRVAKCSTRRCATLRSAYPSTTFPHTERIPQAVRSFLVGCAIRLLRRPDRLPPATAKQLSFASEAEARSKVCEPSSMLIHPSSGIEGHREAALEVFNWARGTPVENANDNSGLPPDRALVGEGIREDLRLNRPAWVAILQGYARGAEKSALALNLPEARYVPGVDQWEDVERVILDEVVPAARVSVINSDIESDDRPNFAPELVDGKWRAPRDLVTIFVSGNVMSRGMTLDGLLTTLYSRETGLPLADSQMQMQRWFGYRGPYVDLCRLYAAAGQIELFHTYHDNDEALRRDVLSSMQRVGHSPPDFTVLQGRSFKATGKVSNIRGVSLWPGSRPFLQHMNRPGRDEANQAVVARFLARGLEVVGRKESPRGILCRDPLEILDTAALLDELRFDRHGPGTEGYEASVWDSVANHARLPVSHPLRPLYRAPFVRDSEPWGPVSPYWVAAYLRLWYSCIDRNVPGMITSESPPVRWDLVEHGAARRRLPKFWIGLRFGIGAPVETGPLANLGVPVRSMRRDVTPRGSVSGTWGARNASGEDIRGDELFDYASLGVEPRLEPNGDPPSRIRRSCAVLPRGPRRRGSFDGYWFRHSRGRTRPS